MSECAPSPDRRGRSRTTRTQQAGTVDLDVVVAGYAGIDFIWQASTSPGPGHTALLSGPVEAQPRFGGAGPAVALELAQMGRRVALISWLGDDHYGRAYAALLEAAGVDTAGLVIAAGELSPRTFLFYDPGGGATCCFHPSGSRQQTLDDSSRARLVRSRALALTVCPAALTEGLLDARPPGAMLAWSVKADADAYPPHIRRRLVAEADMLCLNRDELPFLAEAVRDDCLGPAGRLPMRPGVTQPCGGVPDLDVLASAAPGVIVVTAGAAGIIISWTGGRAVIYPASMSVEDPTGAGDTFFAAFLAATLDGAGPKQAARAATDHVTRALRRAAKPETGNAGGFAGEVGGKR